MMEQKNISLVYISSGSIIDFIAEHPIDWSDYRLGGLGAPGDILTPSPAIALFFQLLAERGELFSQSEYVNYVRRVWEPWLDTLSFEQVRGVIARLGCNFYVSAIDSLHVWAMLVETCLFAACVLDTAQDALGKVDISVVPRADNRPLYLALRVDSPQARLAYDYKARYRGVAHNAIVLPLSLDRPKYPGNKRWYNLSDLEPVIFRATGGML